MSRNGFFAFLLAIIVASCVGVSRVDATDYASANFIVRDPVIGGVGGVGSSSSFELFSSGDFVFSGRSSSASFLGRYGFLYFPYVTQPVLSATAGNAEVDLSWTASDAGLGFDVSGYEYGVTTTSGSSYTFLNVGNVTSTTATSLTNGTTYYFIIRVLDAFGSPIATSAEVSATPTDGTTPSPGSGGGSGTFMGVRFIGYAYPQAVVSVLKNAVLRATTIAGGNGTFTLNLQEPYDETVLYTIYADDIDGRRSLLLNYPLVGSAEKVSEIQGIRFAPTIEADKVATKRGDPVTVSGFALPNTLIEFELSGSTGKVLSGTSASTGRYEIRIPTADLPRGDYALRSRYPNDPRYSLAVRFSVGDTNVFPAVTPDVLPGDCNADQQITLQDFSVLAYWYGKQNPPACIDANGDGEVTLVDFSILAYYWSG
jgi:hypothetical protein